MALRGSLLWSAENLGGIKKNANPSGWKRRRNVPTSGEIAEEIRRVVSSEAGGRGGGSMEGFPQQAVLWEGCLEEYPEMAEKPKMATVHGVSGAEAVGTML